MDESNENESIQKLTYLLKERESELQTDLKFLDNHFMMKYLRARDFDIEKAANAIIKYFNFRVRHPDWFRDHRNSPGFLEVFKSNMMVMNRSALNRKKCDEGERVIYQRTDRWHIEKYSIKECVYVGILRMEYYGLTDHNCYGIRHIQSCSGVTLAKMWKIPMHLMKEWNELMETALPVKVNGINFTDVNSVFLFFFKIFQAFISAEMKARISLIGSTYDELFNYYDRSCIPLEMGGDWNVADDEIHEDKIREGRFNLMCDTVVKYWEKTPAIKKL